MLTMQALREAGRATKEDAQALHETRLRLEAVVLGVCSECERPITALDAACRSEIREPDGEQWTHWYHASCVGCDESEAVRWAGCSGCAREWAS